MNFRFNQIFYAAPDAGGALIGGGGGGGPGGGNPPAAAGAADPGAGGSPGRDGSLGSGAGSQPGSGEGANAWKAPDFLPEHLRDADVSKTFEKVSADWRRLRDTVANLPQPPKSAEEYKFEPGDKLKPYFGDLSKDPAYAAVRDAALKAGVPPGQFTGMVNGFFETLADKGMLPKPYNPETERDALIGESARLMTPEQKDEAIRPLLMPTVQFLDGLKRTGVIDNAGYAALGGLLDTAAGVRALAKIVELSGKGAPPGLNPGGAGGAGQGVSHSDLKARQRDPRNTPGSMSFDPAYRAETDRLYQQTFR